MAKQVLSDCKVYLGGYDLTGAMNAVAFDQSVDLQDSTVFGDAARRRLAGLLDTDVGIDGFFDPTIEKTVRDQMGLTDVPLTVSPGAGADGDLAYAFKAAAAGITVGAAVGQMFGFKVSAHGTGVPMVRGLLMGAGAKAATGNGTGRQLGAVAAGKKIYAALHVLAISGTDTPTLTVKLQSDDNSGFTSATDRHTFADFTDVTDVGAEWAAVAGAITDDYWRFVWTISGTDPSFTIAAFAGIL